MEAINVQENTTARKRSHCVTNDTFVPSLRERTLLGILPTGETLAQEAARLRTQEPLEVEFA